MPELGVNGRTVDITTEAHYTEMGIKLTAVNPRVILTLEFDPDEDPQVMLAMLHFVPQMLKEQVQRLIESDQLSTRDIPE